MKKFLVVGCGSIGRRHIKNLMALNAGEVVGADSRQDRLDQVRQECGVQRTFLDYREALKAEKFDGVLVTLPPHLHVDVCTLAAEAGSALFIEKPLAHNLEGLQGLNDLVKKKNVKAFVAYCHRFIPYSDKVKELLAQKVIGKVVSFRMEWGSYLPDWHPWEDYRTFYMAKKEQGGGALLDESHGIDLIRSWLGEVKTVSGFVGNVSPLEISSDDLASLVLRFESGVIGTANFDLIRRTPKIFVEIIGTDGVIEWDRMQHHVRVYHATKKEWETFQYTSADLMSMYTKEISHFVACAENKEEPLVDVADGIKTMEVLMAAFASSAQKKEITVGS